MAKGISFEEGLRYPWKNKKRLWNILWILIPIVGLFAIIGYAQRIVQAMAKGDFRGLPAFNKFWENCGNGFMVFIRLIPLMIVVMLMNFIPLVGNVAYLFVAIFMLPYMIINFLVKDKFSALWEVEKTINVVFKNVTAYLIAFAKQIVFVIVYGIASIILIGIPCYVFGNAIFLADFYRNHSR